MLARQEPKYKTKKKNNSTELKFYCEKMMLTFPQYVVGNGSNMFSFFRNVIKNTKT